MKTVIAFFIFIVLSALVNAQTGNGGSITVAIKNEKHNAIENATVALIKSKDSTLVKLDITNDKGITEFEHVPFGSYFIKATMVNHITGYSAPINVSPGNKSEVTVLLNQKASEMKEVVVAVKKTFYSKIIRSHCGKRR